MTVKKIQKIKIIIVLLPFILWAMNVQARVINTFWGGGAERGLQFPCGCTQSLYVEIPPDHTVLAARVDISGWIQSAGSIPVSQTTLDVNADGAFEWIHSGDMAQKETTGDFSSQVIVPASQRGSPMLIRMDFGTNGRGFLLVSNLYILSFDMIGPSFSNFSPAAVESGVEFDIYCDIYDPSGIYDDDTGSEAQGVYLLWDNDNELIEDANEVQMSLYAGDTFKTDEPIPRQLFGDSFVYEVFAYDDDFEDNDPNNRTKASSGILSVSIIPGDWDGDGIKDDVDNCPTTYNPDQADREETIELVLKENADAPISLEIWQKNTLWQSGSISVSEGKWLFSANNRGDDYPSVWYIALPDIEIGNSYRAEIRYRLGSAHDQFQLFGFRTSSDLDDGSDLPHCGCNACYGNYTWAGTWPIGQFLVRTGDDEKYESLHAKIEGAEIVAGENPSAYAGGSGWYKATLIYAIEAESIHMSGGILEEDSNTIVNSLDMTFNGDLNNRPDLFGIWGNINRGDWEGCSANAQMYFDNITIERIIYGDGVGDACDNCPDTYNPEQKDHNSNGIGDACETITIDMELEGGWSMISLPVEPEDATIATLFPDAVAVFKFTTKYVLMNSGESLEKGIGYWIYIPDAKTYSITGAPFGSYSMPDASIGWSMIGSCSDPSRASVTNGTIRAVFGFTNKYIFIGSGNNVGPLEPGRGYWVNLSEETDFNVEME